MFKQRLRQLLVIAFSLTLASLLLLFRSGAFSSGKTEPAEVYASNQLVVDTMPVKDSAQISDSLRRRHRTMMYSSKTMMPLQPSELSPEQKKDSPKQRTKASTKRTHMFGAEDPDADSLKLVSDTVAPTNKKAKRSK